MPGRRGWRALRRSAACTTRDGSGRWTGRRPGTCGCPARRGCRNGRRSRSSQSRRRPVEEGLVYGTGVVVVESTGDLLVWAITAPGRMRAASSTIIAGVSSPCRASAYAAESAAMPCAAHSASNLSASSLPSAAVSSASSRQARACASSAPHVSTSSFAAFVRADLVELVDLAKHSLDVGQAKSAVEAFGQLAVVRVHGRLG